MDKKLELCNYSVDGKVTGIKEGLEPGLINIKTLSFNYFNKKLNCQAAVTFVTDKFDIDLYDNAVRFVKRLK